MIVVSSIDISGLRKAHLRQLADYIRARDEIGEQWYSGNREQFEARHVDLLALAATLYELVDNNEKVIAKKSSKRAGRSR
jgi:hypothetical protein